MKSLSLRFGQILGPFAFLCLLLPMLTSLSFGQDQDEKPSDQKISVNVNLVTLRFSIRNSAGQFLNSLQQDKFRIFENGVEQKIVFFEPPKNARTESGPLWLAFLLDVSGSTYSTRSKEIIAAQTFFDNIQNFTQIGVYGFTDKLIPFQDFTASREQALRAFNTAHQHLGQTAIYDSISALISRMSSRAAPEDQKVIIVVSDAMDKAYAKAQSIIALAKTNHISFYTILVPSAAQLYIAGSSPGNAEPTTAEAAEKAQKEAAFAELARETGGRDFSGIETILDFDDTLAQINDDIYGNLYAVGYNTEDPQLDKRQRNIRVGVDSPSAQVSALYQNVPERMTLKKQFIAALFDNSGVPQIPEQQVDYGFHEIGAQIDVLSSRSADGGRTGLPFRIKISPYTLRGNDKEGIRTQFGILGTLIDGKGNEVVRLREFFRVTLRPKELREGRGIVYTNKLLAPPGVYDLRIALLELASWKMTAFEDRVQINGE